MSDFPHPWTIDALKEHLETLIDRSSSQTVEHIKSVRDLTTQALMASREAILKAEAATEKRFESVNEFRATLDQQQRTLMPRAEAEIRFQSLVDQLTVLRNRTEQRVGWKEGVAYAVAAAGFIVALAAVLLK
jgi:hypothetical protein